MIKLNFRIIFIVIVFFIGGNHICAQNQFFQKIDSDLSSFEKKSDIFFLKDDYDILKQRISFFYSQKKIELAESQNLKRRLYASYVSKFLSRSFREFNGTVWNVDTLNFIRKEVTRVRSEGKSEQIFEDKSESGKKMDLINKIFKDYDKINWFVASSKKFFHSSNYALTDSFPNSKVEKILSDRDGYLKSGKYPYTSKCARLNDDLKSVTKALFSAHVKYLNNKLAHLSECYKETETDSTGVVIERYSSQPIYREQYYEVMKQQLRSLKQTTSKGEFLYKGCDVLKEYNRLLKKLDDQNGKAYEYYESKLGN